MKQTTALHALIILIAIVLAGCASMATPQTQEQQVAYATSTLAAINNTAASMLERGRISLDDAKMIMARSAEAEALLRVARTNKGQAGADALSAATSVLTELETYLRAKEAQK